MRFGIEFGMHSVAQAVVVIGLVAIVGLALGAIKIRGLSLGIAGVLFSGIVFGHFGFTLDHQVLEFAREAGLILFVYTIGMQVGPGFFSSFKKQGLPLNILAICTVVLGCGVTILFILNNPGSANMAIGVLAGATTNTPSLASAQQALQDIPAVSAEALKLPGLGYALAYPFGVTGVILVLLVLRLIFRVRIEDELNKVRGERKEKDYDVSHISLEVTNTNLVGLPLSRVPTLRESGVVISRLMRVGHAPELAKADHTLAFGDILHAVGPKQKLEQLVLIIGAESTVDLRKVDSSVTAKDILVTQSWALGQSLETLELGSKHGVTATRLRRSGVQLPVRPGMTLQFGDQLRLVGEELNLRAVAKSLGNSLKQLDSPRLIPIFIGIVLGVAIGSYPIELPGVPSPVRLGLAGGPLLAAIFLSRLGNIGPLVWHMPSSANFMMREMGIVLFLSCVGLKAGDQFVNTLMNGQALYWLGCGATITLVPLLVVGSIARFFYKMNYLYICGVLAGSMTDPPALSFATSITGSDEPSVSYSTVYPLTMFLRVVSTQILVIFFCR